VKRFWNGNIFIKLLITYIFITILSVFISNAISFFGIKDRMNKDHDNFTYDQLNGIATFIRTGFEQRWSRSMLLSSLDLIVNRQNRSFYVYDGAGHLLYRFGNAASAQPPGQEIVVRVLAENRLVREVQQSDDGNNIFLLALPLRGPAGMTEKALVMMDRDFPRNIRMMNNRLWLSILVGIIISGVCVYFFSRKITAPVLEMNRKAKLIAKGHFDQRIQVTTKDEIGELAETFNRMAAELGSLDQMRRDFVANVSHDLRSPLTSIRGYVTALLDRTIPQGKERHYLEIVHLQTERLIKLVNDLLDIARMEAGQFRLRVVPFDLTERIRLVLASFEPEFARKRLTIELQAEGEEGMVVEADPDRIDQVIANLLQNAVQFSPPNSPLEVILERRGGQAAVSVRDHGTGIKSEEMPFIWERFYKGDKARSNMSGTGIGLAIVKHILDLHGAPVSVESAPGGGSTFTFLLPLAPLALSRASE
jgi:signal transduction histidine kinase